MAKKKKRDPVELPPELVEAVDEAATELAAETNLTKAEARERILSKIQARADADAEDVEDAAEEVEDEETDEDQDTKGKKGKGKKDEDEDQDEDTDEDEDEPPARDEKPPATHWASRPMFKSRR